jgi:sec-independent protein translocase protein TatB
MASEFQGQLMDAMREADIAEVRREAQKLADAARVDVGLDSLHDLDRQMVAHRPAPVPDAAAQDASLPEPMRDTSELSPSSSARAPHSA